MDWKKIFSDPATAAVMLASGTVGLVIGIANGVVQKKHGGWGALAGAIATAIAVAIMVGLGISDYISSEPVRLAIVGACALISEDIREGLKTLGQGLRSDPLGSVVRILDALRGRASPAPAPTDTPKE